MLLGLGGVLCLVSAGVGEMATGAGPARRIVRGFRGFGVSLRGLRWDCKCLISAETG